MMQAAEIAGEAERHGISHEYGRRKGVDRMNVESVVKRAAGLVGALMLAVALLPGLAGAQEVRDSLLLTIYERPVSATVTGPSRVYKGDSIVYRARVVDAAGQPTVAFLVWSVSDTARAFIRPISDSTALVVARKSGPLKVTVKVGPLDSLVVGMIAQDGTVDLVGAGGVQWWVSEQFARCGDYFTNVPPSDWPLPCIAAWQDRPTADFCAVFFSGDAAWGFHPAPCVTAWVAEHGHQAPFGPDDRLSLYRGWVMEQPGQSVWELRERIAALKEPVVVRVAGLR
jgi:hypothetical protein